MSASGGAPQRVKRLLKSGWQFTQDAFEYLAFPLRYSRSRGVYATLDGAIRAAPRGKGIGYNHASLAREYADNLDLRVTDHDFPWIYYLAQVMGLLKGVVTIVDFGGNVGVHYLKFSKYLDMERVRWLICEVPEIAKKGRERCEGQKNLEFVTDLGQIDTADVVLAIGSAQYVHLFDLLSQSAISPRYILIGQILLHDGPEFVTLQNGGRVYYPQYVFRRAEFIDRAVRAGFRVHDIWHDSTNGCVIPFHRDLAIESTGLCLVTTQSA